MPLGLRILAGVGALSFLMIGLSVIWMGIESLRKPAAPVVGPNTARGSGSQAFDRPAALGPGPVAEAIV